MNFIRQALDWLRAYPEATAVLFGTLASWSGATLLEAVFMPLTWTRRKAIQVTVLTNLILGTVVSFMVWRAMDPHAPGSLDFVISLTCALISPFSYVWVAKVSTHFCPWIGSVWAMEEPAQSPGPVASEPLKPT